MAKDKASIDADNMNDDPENDNETESSTGGRKKYLRTLTHILYERPKLNPKSRVFRNCIPIPELEPGELTQAEIDVSVQFNCVCFGLRER
jgi:hypothetical protein